MPDFIYIDAGVVIAYLKGEPHRSEIIDAVLENARIGKVPETLITSTISIAEVAWITAQGGASPTSLQEIETFWDESPIQIVEVNLVHAVRARELIHARANQPVIHPEFNTRKHAADALHLASAMAIGCKEFWTYNVRDFRNYRVTGIDFVEPHVGQMRLDLS